MKQASEILKGASEQLGIKARIYDKPEGERSMGATVTAFKAVAGISMTEEQGYLFMTILKAVRSQQGAYSGDSYVDGSTYFALAGEAASVERMTDKEVSQKLREIVDNGRAQCDCASCFSRRVGAGIGPLLRRGMYVCPRCGNKRCPKAEDHRHACTGSNEDGQVGVLETTADAWIEWSGGAQPASDSTLVQVRFGNKELSAGIARCFFWGNTSDGSDIIAYRLSPEGAE